MMVVFWHDVAMHFQFIQVETCRQKFSYSYARTNSGTDPAFFAIGTFSSFTGDKELTALHH
jgi:hypothetical protein